MQEVQEVRRCRRCGGAEVRTSSGSGAAVWRCGSALVRPWSGAAATVYAARRSGGRVAAEPIYWQRRALSRDGEKKNDKT